MPEISERTLKNIEEFLECTSEQVGEIITEYTWRECVGLLYQIKKDTGRIKEDSEDDLTF